MTAQTIFTIDDLRTMRAMLMLTLSDAGYRVVQAVDGVQGLDVLRRRGASHHRYGHQFALGREGTASRASSPAGRR